jgi:hypothetical protein
MVRQDRHAPQRGVSNTGQQAPQVGDESAPVHDQRADAVTSGFPGRPDALATLNLKLTRSADLNSAVERLQGIPGLHDIEPLFPGEEQEDLRTIFVARIEPGHLEEAVPKVAADDDVEYVEEPAPRKLV